MPLLCEKMNKIKTKIKPFHSSWSRVLLMHSHRIELLPVCIPTHTHLSNPASFFFSNLLMLFLPCIYLFILFFLFLSRHFFYCICMGGFFKNNFDSNHEYCLLCGFWTIGRSRWSDQADLLLTGNQLTEHNYSHFDQSSRLLIKNAKLIKVEYIYICEKPNQIICAVSICEGEFSSMQLATS